MSYSNIGPGKDVPNDLNVVIEIAANAVPVKYEVDKDSGALMVDRFMSTGHALSLQLWLYSTNSVW